MLYVLVWHENQFSNCGCKVGRALRARRSVSPTHLPTLSASLCLCGQSFDTQPSSLVTRRNPVYFPAEGTKTVPFPIRYRGVVQVSFDTRRSALDARPVPVGLRRKTSPKLVRFWSISGPKIGGVPSEPLLIKGFVGVGPVFGQFSRRSVSEYP